MKFKIIVRNQRYNQCLLGIQFTNGVGYTDDDKKAQYLQETLCYTVEQNETPEPLPEKKKKVRGGSHV
ncbi:hypothetical protein ACHHV8_11170 [Paenibacillus sp. TAB 01]|uniref:hypothetical protein n=1 Tax=Paenibacillus sp. TAB 01 TaxID=3368988 RepID=UPI00374FE77B